MHMQDIFQIVKVSGFPLFEGTCLTSTKTHTVKVQRDDSKNVVKLRSEIQHILQKITFKPSELNFEVKNRNQVFTSSSVVETSISSMNKIQIPCRKTWKWLWDWCVETTIPCQFLFVNAVHPRSHHVHDLGGSTSWHVVLSPQESTVPSTRRAKECVPPAATFTTWDSQGRRKCQTERQAAEAIRIFLFNRILSFLPA